MEKIILVDGNNLLFRSYYATAYTGNIMKNSKNFPTNALFGFVNMINKIVEEEKPTYMIVAFDKGKTFRHEEYKEYKGGRNATPDDLKKQMPIARQILEYMGIKYYEIDNYEADDIIGTFSHYCNKDSNYTGTIISSDHDLLQLISDDVSMKLLKMKDYVRYNKESFMEEYGIEPIKIIDLKALMGDQSDNIPGVRGIGEKTALKLLREYGSLDGVYENIDKISEKLREKLIEDKENAYLSYHLATIIQDVPVDINLEDIKLKEMDAYNLNKIYEELEFFSFIKKIKKHDVKEPFNILESLVPDKELALYIELLGTNYHTSKILGFGVYSEHNSGFITVDTFLKNPSMFDGFNIMTYDAKRLINSLRWVGKDLHNIVFDTMIAGYLLDYTLKDDISYMANVFGYDVKSLDDIYTKKFIEPDISVLGPEASLKAKFIYETKTELIDKLEKNKFLDFYEQIDFPLSFVLADMEFNGVKVDRNCLEEMDKEISVKIKETENKIYEEAGEKFNISSPKQLGEVLFDKMGLQHGRKGKTGYSTSIDVLNKLKGTHPIVDLIIDYRMLTKIETTYIVGLLNSILKDGKVHTIYTQTLTRTGRLSSIEPNLQNIPVRNEFGKLIRKAFLPSDESVILSADYSQIELRILSHMSGVKSLIDAFNNDVDIHTKTASDIFKVDASEVTSNMRRIAKAVNFGIIYGISNFGLAENLDISMAEATEFINNYLQEYPGIKEYMEKSKKEAYEKGYVKTLFNRKRELPELHNTNYAVRSSGERMALNTPIQGTSADILKKAMIEVQNAFKEKGLQSKMILQVHDELVFDCKKSELEEVIRIVTDIMENTYKLKVPLKVDINYGDNWYLAK